MNKGHCQAQRGKAPGAGRPGAPAERGKVPRISRTSAPPAGPISLFRWLGRTEIIGAQDITPGQLRATPICEAGAGRDYGTSDRGSVE